MRLADLSPDLLRVCDDGSYRVVGMLCEAQGIAFDCPECDGINAHRIYVWFSDRDVPDGIDPEPRWGVSGLDIDTLTLGADVHCVGCWRGWIRAGEVY